MAVESTLPDKITYRLQQHQHELAQRQQQLDARMREMLEERERLSAVGREWIERVILPRMNELKRFFDNCTVEFSDDDNLICACNFAHNTRFPATVRLTILLLPRERHLMARYDLNILPVLMEYPRSVEESFSPQTSEETLATWVENRIIEFLDVYLRLETHPLYQKDNIITDIVCGMQIPLISATSKIERGDRTFFFCSEHCKEVFIKQNT